MRSGSRSAPSSHTAEPGARPAIDPRAIHARLMSVASTDDGPYREGLWEEEAYGADEETKRC